MNIVLQLLTLTNLLAMIMKNIQFNTPNILNTIRANNIDNNNNNIQNNIQDNNFIAPLDYQHVFNKVGTSASAGTETLINKNGTTYKWIFNTACTPLPNNPRITMVREDNLGTKTFHVLTQDNGINCEFRLETINPNIIETNNHLINDLSFVQSQEENKQNLNNIKLGSIEYFKHQFGSYPPQEQQRFRHGDFIISTLDSCNKNSEASYPGNDIDKKQTSLVRTNNGILVNNKTNQVIHSDNNLLYVIDKKGKIYTSNSMSGVHHSYFLKKDGFGKPIACAGWMSVQNGKITSLNNCSGHYKPNKDQLLVASCYLLNQNLLMENAKIQDLSTNFVNEFNLESLKDINPKDILEKYKTL